MSRLAGATCCSSAAVSAIDRVLVAVPNERLLALKPAVLLHQTVLEELAVFIPLNVKLYFFAVLHFEVSKLTLTLVSVERIRCVSPIYLGKFFVGVTSCLASSVKGTPSCTRLSCPKTYFDCLRYQRCR